MIMISDVLFNIKYSNIKNFKTKKIKFIITYTYWMNLKKCKLVFI